jgi:hypothetical protein
MLSVTPCVLASGAPAAPVVLSASSRHLSRPPDRGRLSRQARDAERVEAQLELACGTVVADRLEEQVQDAEAFRDEQQIPDRIESATAR